MSGGFLREYEIGSYEDDYDYGSGEVYGAYGEYDYGVEYGYDEYAEGEYSNATEYGNIVGYDSDYSQGGQTNLPEKEDYEYSSNEVPIEDYDNYVSQKGEALQTNKTWLFNGNTWEEKTPMSIPRDRPACSIISMPDGEVAVHVWEAFIAIVLYSHNTIQMNYSFT